MPRLLFVGPAPKVCGVYQFGSRIYRALETADFLETRRADVRTWEEFLQAHEAFQPDITLYSAVYATQPYLFRPEVRALPGRHLGLCHEPEQCMIEGDHTYPDYFLSESFDAWIAFDPTLKLPENERRGFLFGRVLPEFPESPPPRSLTFGCQCLGIPERGHLKFVQAILREYPRKHVAIRLHVLPAHWSDPTGAQARAIVEACRAAVRPPARITFDTRFLEEEEAVIRFLADNTANGYLYLQRQVPSFTKGVASSPDLSLAAGRPTLVSDCTLFRHLHPYLGAYPRDGSLATLIERQQRSGVLQELRDLWSIPRFLEGFRRVLERLL